MKNPLTTEQLAAIRRLDTCSVSNAIESFDRRLRNEGFTDARIRCCFPRLPAMLGFAAPIRIRTGSPPAQGHAYVDRADSWNYLQGIPAPRIVVAQDVDDPPGVGALFGEIHANILLALGCAGVVTNGAVRDLPAVEAAGFPCFAGSVAVSHAYAHIIEVGHPVEVGGLVVHPGDLLQGDAHGVLSIPLDLAVEIPDTAARIAAKERKLMALCRSEEFSLERLRSEVEQLEGTGTSS